MGQDPSSTDGVVIPFPVMAQPSCVTCVHARFLDDGTTWCTVYDEIIYSELYAAEDCYTYEFCPEGSQLCDLTERLVEEEQ